VCANESGHVSKDGGETWSCDLCMGVHDTEQRVA
jgi:Zn-finger protein